MQRRQQRINEIKNQQLNESDPKQYLQLIQSIQSIKLPNNEDIPAVVCEQIAEYVTALIGQQYLSLFKTMKAIKLPNNESMPSAICEEIVEYVTALVENCRNKNCSKKVVALQYDEHVKRGYFSMNTLAWFYNQNYRYSGCYMDEKTKCYCSQCMLHTKLCPCWEGTMFLLNNGKCQMCNNAIQRCDDRECEHGYDLVCYLCEKLLCEKCCKYCNRCSVHLCSECYDEEKEGKFVLWKCDTKGCDTAVYARHSMLIECEGYYDLGNVEYCEDCGIEICTKCEYDHIPESTDYDEYYLCKKCAL